MTDATKHLAAIARRAVMAMLAAALLLSATLVLVATTAAADEASTSRAAPPVGRIVNNTLFGAPSEAAGGAGPTLLDNVILY